MSEFDRWLAGVFLSVSPETARTTRDAWNAALSAVEAKMPGTSKAERPESKAGYWLDGFNTYRGNALHVISELRSPPSRPGQPSERGTDVDGFTIGSEEGLV